MRISADDFSTVAFTQILSGKYYFIVELPIIIQIYICSSRKVFIPLWLLFQKELFRVLEKDFIFSELLPHSYILQTHAVKSPAVFFPIHLISIFVIK